MEQERSTADLFTERERQLIRNSLAYSRNNPGGFPGHNLIIVIAKLAALYDSVAGEERPFWVEVTEVTDEP